MAIGPILSVVREMLINSYISRRPVVEQRVYRDAIEVTGNRLRQSETGSFIV